MKKEKKGISCSYALLVIILFAAFAFVTDYAFIQNKMSNCSSNVSVVKQDGESSGSVTGVEENGTNIEGVEESNSNEINNSIVNNTKDISHYNDYGQIIVTKEGNVLYSPEKGYNLLENDILIKGVYEVDDYLLGPDDNILNGYKLNTSNIKSAYSFSVGNGGVTVHVVLLTRDNKVEIFRIHNSSYNNLEVSFERLDNLSNIVTAVESDEFGAHGYVFYDSNGNLVKSNY